MGGWKQNHHPTKQPAGILNQSCPWWQPGRWRSQEQDWTTMEGQSTWKPVRVYFGEPGECQTLLLQSHTWRQGPAFSSPFSQCHQGCTALFFTWNMKRKSLPPCKSQIKGQEREEKTPYWKYYWHILKSSETEVSATSTNLLLQDGGKAIRALKKVGLWCRLINICFNSLYEATKC